MCEKCGKCFKQAATLWVHNKRTHENAKKFQCQKCQKRFLNRFYLRLHQTLHTKEKNFECNVHNKYYCKSCLMLYFRFVLNVSQIPLACDVTCGYTPVKNRSNVPTAVNVSHKATTSNSIKRGEERALLKLKISKKSPQVTATYAIGILKKTTSKRTCALTPGKNRKFAK